ncbi:hypothetical protein PRIPAC_92229 [Pristionchus pacificus]|uniref:Uncharacterized protein n=1 Tax=Pristionchus pacificus TaxID=54126 RepID=A0A2A6BA69_PRIPA|nr:hypothetical protein PRIPAC_92229 [Pristionchus pacificus]|eukprot:PDM62770.1 hypothetical protein PRIPAC_49985 [Pristionchus pacificus]
MPKRLRVEDGGCSICLCENPHRRAVMFTCGHVTCSMCAEEMAVLLLLSLGASLSLCCGGVYKKKIQPARSSARSKKSNKSPGEATPTVPGTYDTLKTAIDGGSNSEVAGTGEGMHRPPSAEIVQSKKTAPGKVHLSKEKV